MSSFASRLNKVLIETKKVKLYKGVSISSGYDKWISATHIVPGFLSSFYIGLIYSDPQLTGSEDDPSLIAEVVLDDLTIIDKTDEFMSWCKEKGQEPDISQGFPKEWRSLVWTVYTDSSGHGGVSCYGGADFVYCGISHPFRIVKHFRNYGEWEKEFRRSRTFRCPPEPLV